MPAQDHILIVDDDAEIRRLLQTYFEKNSYRVSTAADGRALRSALKSIRPDIVILDLMLPGEDGLTLCRDLRARSNIPILMLTARGEETDRIVGLEMGADDYLAKPFHPRELLARVKSILRRARSLPDNLQPERIKAFRFAGWTLDVATRTLTAPDGVLVDLSGTEFRLLRTFVDHPNRTLTRDQLIDLMLARDAGPFDRAIDVQVSRLRHRLRDNGKEPTLIWVISISPGWRSSPKSSCVMALGSRWKHASVLKPPAGHTGCSGASPFCWPPQWRSLLSPCAGPHVRCKRSRGQPKSWAAM
jgi:two-component system OmpR family response regulator